MTNKNIKSTKYRPDTLSREVVKERDIIKIKTFEEAIDNINKSLMKMNRNTRLTISSTEKEFDTAIKEIKQYEKEMARMRANQKVQERRRLEEEHAERIELIEKRKAITQESLKDVSQTKKIQAKLQKQINKTRDDIANLMSSIPKTKSGGFDKRTKDYQTKYPQLIDAWKKEIELTKELDKERKEGAFKEADRQRKAYLASERRYNKQLKDADEQYQTKINQIDDISIKENTLLHDQYDVRQGIYALERKQNEILYERLEIFDYMGRQFNTFFDGFTKVSPLLSAPLRLMKYFAGKQIQKNIRPMLTPSKDTAKIELDKDEKRSRGWTPGTPPGTPPGRPPRVDPDKDKNDGILQNLLQESNDICEKQNNIAIDTSDKEIDVAEKTGYKIDEGTEETKKGFNLLALKSMMSMILGIGKVAMIGTVALGALWSIGKTIQAIEKWLGLGDNPNKPEEESHKEGAHVITAVVDKFHQYKKDYEENKGFLNVEEQIKAEENIATFQKRADEITRLNDEKNRLETQLKEAEEKKASHFQTMTLKGEIAKKDKRLAEIGVEMQKSGEVRKITDDIQHWKEVTGTDQVGKRIDSDKRRIYRADEMHDPNISTNHFREIEAYREIQDTHNERQFRADETTARINQVENAEVRAELHQKQRIVDELTNELIQHDSSNEKDISKIRSLYLGHTDETSRENTQRESVTDKHITTLNELAEETGGSSMPPIHISAPPVNIPPSNSDSILKEVQALLESIDSTLRQHGIQGL